MKPKPTLRALRARRIAAYSAALVALTVTAFAQTNGVAAGSAGTAIFDSFASVALKSMKEPGKTVGVGPKRLDFKGVSVNKTALNILEITNGTNSKIEIESLSVPSSGFRIAGSLSLPIVIPPPNPGVA